FPESRSRRRTWHMAWEREETSFTSVAWVVRFRFPSSIRRHNSSSELASFSLSSPI
ncbi:hypothetical protein NGA_2063500, partial [Nannochloropsis gaditana CCMP526]|uniref:uncharacterized protein n=1 Tax=Nannochloropsis gaditana (strain CCMP526) TaxID=1093141 RepID=UPI00029F4F78